MDRRLDARYMVVVVGTVLYVSLMQSDLGDPIPVLHWMPPNLDSYRPSLACRLEHWPEVGRSNQCSATTDKPGESSRFPMTSICDIYYGARMANAQLAL